MRARRFSKLVLLSALLIVALVSFAAQDARAAGKTFTVNDTTDAVDAHPGDGVCATAQGKCTLRAAVQEANATPGADTIVLPSGTFKLTIVGNDDVAAVGDLDILEDVTIQGAGSSNTIIDANQIDRAFDIYHALAGGGQHIDIKGVTIRNGLADYGAGILVNAATVAVPVPGTVTLTDVVIRDSHATLAGGGIANAGTLVVSGSTITGNRAASGDIGGGIFNNGNLTIAGSTISNNSADQVGGGLYTLGLGAVYISASTFSGNSAGSQGGGVANFGGVVMTNTTFSGNTAGTTGGAIYNGARGGRVILLNVTLAGDSAPTGSEVSHDNTAFSLKNTIIAGATAGKNCAGTLLSDGNNLSSDASCGLTHAGDKASTDPMLAPLADNGGPTQTLALLAGSPAIDAGSADCPPPATDQRGRARPAGAHCDIGAFEFGGKTERVWGDLRCDGAVDATDALADLLNFAGAPPIMQTQPCPQIGSTVDVQGFSPHTWGDVDCSGTIDVQDVLRIERFVAGLPISPVDSCPLIGATVRVSG